MTEHWSADPDRLLLPTEAMDGETRVLARQARMADNQRTRAYRTALGGRRTWEQGDPGRKGSPPWRSFCREQWDMGVEDRTAWLHEQAMAKMAAQAEKVLRQAAREQKREERARAERRKRRARVARKIFPRTARRLRRWRREYRRLRGIR